MQKSNIRKDPFTLEVLSAPDETFSPPVQVFVDRLLEMERGTDPEDLNVSDRDEQERWLLQAMPDLQASDDEVPPAVEARALIYYGRILVANGNAGEAEEVLTEAHDLFRTLRAMPWQAEALYYRSISRLAAQRFTSAGADLEQARHLWMKAGQPKRALTAMNAKATMQFFIGQFESARQIYQRVLAQIDGDHIDTELAVRHNLATIAFEVGDPAEAVQEYQTILAILEDREMRVEVAKCRQNLAAAQVALERYDEAMEEMDAAIAIYRDIGNRTGEAETMHNKAFLLQDISQLKEAYTLYRETLDLRREIGDESGQGLTLAQLGLLAADDLERFDAGLRLLCAGQIALDLALDWRREQVAEWILDLAKEQGISHDDLDVIWEESAAQYEADGGDALLDEAFSGEIDWEAASETRSRLIDEVNQYLQDLTLRSRK